MEIMLGYIACILIVVIGVAIGTLLATYNTYKVMTSEKMIKKWRKKAIKESQKATKQIMQMYKLND